MKISIVIRSHNEDEHIERLLLGIRAQRLKPHEVILVDSGSTDRTVEIARRYVDRVVPIDKAEFTFGRALNRGIEAASGDICVFPSAHVYPLYDTWLEDLVAPFADERVVLSYGRQSGNHLNKFSEHRIFAKWFPAVSACPQKGYFCNNANCAIRRSVWEVQPYDETLTGLEDLAWAKAAQAAGGWLAYAAEAEIAHVHDETWAQVHNRYRREAIAMSHIDEHARFSMFDFVGLLVSNIAADLSAAFAQGVLWREFRSIVLFRFNQMLGTYRGHNDPPEVSNQLRSRFYYPMSPHEKRLAAAEHERHRIDYDALESEAKGGARVVRIAGDKK
ncbi:MAG: glycosyltransferase family 2 protein [Hyphomonadaceae bacterium]